jgi:hypothetical protein
MSTNGDMQMPNKPERRAAINVYITKQLRHAFKMAVTHNDLTMQKVIADFIQQYVESIEAEYTEQKGKHDA